MNRKSRSLGRRSSILKIDLQNQDDTTAYRSRISSRRVSFAETCQVKEFARESPRHFKHSETDEEEDANHEQTPAPKAVSITGLDTLLTGTIQPQPCQEVMQFPLPDLSSSSFTFDINKTVLDTMDMDMTGVCGDINDSHMEIDFQPEPSIEIKSFLQSLKAAPSKSMETTIYTSNRDSIIYSDSRLGVTVTTQQAQVRSPLESLPVQSNISFNHPEKENMIPLTIVDTPEILEDVENDDTAPILDAKSFLSNFGAKMSNKETGLSLGNLLKSSTSSVMSSQEPSHALKNDLGQVCQPKNIAADVEGTRCQGDNLVTDNAGIDISRFTDVTKYFQDEDDHMGVEITRCIGGIVNLKEQLAEVCEGRSETALKATNLSAGTNIEVMDQNSDTDQAFGEETTKYFGEKTVALEETRCIGGILRQEMTGTLSAMGSISSASKSVRPASDHVCDGDNFGRDKTEIMAVGLEETQCIGRILNDSEVEPRNSVTTVFPAGVEMTRCVGGILDAQEIDPENPAGKTDLNTQSDADGVDDYKQNTTREANQQVDEVRDRLSTVKDTLSSISERDVIMEYTAPVPASALEADTQCGIEDGNTEMISLKKRLSAISESAVGQFPQTDKTVYMLEGMEETACLENLNSGEETLRNIKNVYATQAEEPESKIKNVNATQVEVIAMEETQCVGIQREQPTTQEGMGMSVNVNKTVMDHLDIEETMCTGGVGTQSGIEDGNTGMIILKRRLSAISNRSVRMEETKCIEEPSYSECESAVSQFARTDKTIYMSEGMEETACLVTQDSGEETLRNIKNVHATQAEEPESKIGNVNATQVEVMAMEETQRVDIQREQPTKPEDMGVPANVNKTVMEHFDIEETVCTGGILNKTCDTSGREELEQTLSEMVAERSQLSPLMVNDKMIGNIIASPVSAATHTVVTKSGEDELTKGVDTTTDLSKKRRSSGVGDLRKQLLNMGSQMSSQSKASWMLCDADSTTPLPDSTSNVSEGNFSLSKADSTTQLVNANITGAPMSATQILEANRLSGITDSTAMLLASRPTEDTDDGCSLSPLSTSNLGHVTNMAAMLETSVKVDTSLSHGSAELEFGEEPGLNEVRMPDGMDTDICSTTTMSSSDGSSDTRNCSNTTNTHTVSFLSNKSFASSFAIPEGPLTLETLFRLTYRPSQNMATNSRYSIVLAPRIDFEDMMEVLQAEISLKPLVEAKKQMKDNIKDKTNKNQVNIELLQETLEETQPQLFKDCQQASEEEMMKISDQMKSLHSYCFKEAELAWKRRTRDMFATVNDYLKSTGHGRAEQILDEVRSDAATVEELLSSVEAELTDLEKTECLLEELQNKERALSSEKESINTQIQTKLGQQQQLQSELDAHLEQETLGDQRLHLRQTIQAHLRCVNWELAQFEEDFLTCSFCEGQLLLRVDYCSELTERKIQQISLRSLHHKGGSRLHERVLHAMVLSAVDTSALQEQFLSLPQVIAEVSRIVGEIERFCRDIKSLNSKHKMSYKDDSFSIELYNKESLDWITLSLTFDHSRPLSSPAKISAQTLLGDLNSEDITRKLGLVKPGPCYLSRLIEESGL